MILFDVSHVKQVNRSRLKGGIWTAWGHIAGAKSKSGKTPKRWTILGIEQIRCIWNAGDLITGVVNRSEKVLIHNI